MITVISTSCTIMSTFIKKKFIHICKLTYFASWPGTFTSCLLFQVVSLELRERDMFSRFSRFSENSLRFSENNFSRKKFPSRNSGAKNIIYPSRSRKRKRENYGV